MMLKRLTILPLALLLAMLSGCGGKPGGAPKHLVLICMDTVRFDTFFLPEQGAPADALSPHMNDAVVFSKTESAAPWTVPSVVTVLTGLYPAHHGAGRFDDPVANLNKDVPSKLPDAVDTLAEMLGEAGFRSVALVAHPWFKAGYGMAQGFDELHMNHGAMRLSKAGMKWLTGQKNDRAFLYLHFMEAHDRHSKPEEYDRWLKAADPAYLARARAIAPGGICKDPQSDMCRRYQVYATAVRDERRAVAQVLDSLRENGLADDTVVMIYADHGEAFQDHLQAATALDADPRGFRGIGHGQSLYQELLHVPLVAWNPRLPGQDDGDVVSLVDVAPTLLHWLGVDAGGEPFDGRPATGVETGGARPFRWADYDPARWPDMDRTLFASGIAYGPEQFAVLKEGRKYVWHEASNGSELYDLKADPGEHDPEARPEAIAGLESALDRYFRWYQSAGVEAANVSDEQVEALKGVGYLQGRESSKKDDDKKGH